MLNPFRQVDQPRCLTSTDFLPAGYSNSQLGLTTPSWRKSFRSYRKNPPTQLREPDFAPQFQREGTPRFPGTQAIAIKLQPVARHRKYSQASWLAFGVALISVLAGCKRAPLTETGVIAVFGSVGLGDGAFNYPRAIASDRQRNVFVVDKTGRIQRFDRSGQFELSWKTPETTAGFPVGIAVHADGRIFVADTHYHRVLVYDRDGNLQTSFGQEGMGDGQFQLPTDIAFDGLGFVYVSEYYGNDRVTKWSPDLRFVKAMGEEPIADARLSRPTGLIVDDEQTLWIADACNHRLVRMTLEGEVQAVVGSYGSGPGQMRYPYDISQGSDGSLMVCEYEGNRLQWFSKAGKSLRIWGRAGRAVGELFAPWGAVYGPNNWIYVVDSLNSRVQVIEP